PDPAICNTNMTIASALPTSPNIDTTEYTMVINTQLINNPKTTNHTGCATGTTSKNIYPFVTTSVCNSPIVRKVSKRPKYIIVGLISPGNSVLKREISNNAPTQMESTV